MAIGDPPAAASETEDPEAKFAAKARDIGSLLQAVADAAKVGSALWLSYIFLLAFLLVAVGSVTHRDLFLENPVALPFLSVNLPLIAFFLVGPALFLVAHAYVLLHFVLLADKVRAFHVQLVVQVKNPTVRMQLRRQLPADIFAQALAGPSPIRNGTIGAMLMAIAWISLAIGPVLLLLLFELQFLAFHSAAATWWHRIAIVIDLLLLWRLWPAVLRGRIAPPSWLQVRRARLPLAASVASVLLVFTVGTYPGEALNNLPNLTVLPWSCDLAKSRWMSLHQLMMDDGCPPQRPATLWSNRIKLVNFEPPRRPADREAAGRPAPARLDLSGRNLEGMVLISGDLNGANLTSVNLRGAYFDSVQLQAANLTTADLSGATLRQVGLQKALLAGTRLQAAWLGGGANLVGAVFMGTALDGAVLDGARMRGAYLTAATLQGASLKNASMEGVTAGMQMMGAALDGANLSGASLAGSQLQGATFTNAILRATDLDRALLWHASAQAFYVPPVSVFGTPDWTPTHVKVDPNLANQGLTGPFAWDAAAYATLVERLSKELPDGSLKKDALQRIAALDCSTVACAGDGPSTPAIAGFRAAIDRASGSTMEEKVQAQASVFFELVCGARDIDELDAMVRSVGLRLAINREPRIVERLLEPDCAMGKVLTDPQKAQLEAMRSQR
jgi:uncharacterized protein YjbI with pentapeptide repeats